MDARTLARYEVRSNDSMVFAGETTDLRAADTVAVAASYCIRSRRSILLAVAVADILSMLRGQWTRMSGGRIYCLLDRKRTVNIAKPATTSMAAAGSGIGLYLRVRSAVVSKRPSGPMVANPI